MCRIQLEDSAIDMVTKMSDGNPGAITAMMEIIAKHDSIDPQAAMGGIGAILILDTWKIYGSDIYILFNDKCNRDVRKMLVLLRAVQLGHLSETKLRQMASDQMREVDLTEQEWLDIDKTVCDELEQFQRPVVS